MEDAPKAPFLAATRTEGLILAGFLIAVSIFVGTFIGGDEGDVAGLSAGAMMALIRISWPVRKEPWFWTALASFIAIHVFAITQVDWSFTRDWSGRAFSSLMVPDLAAMMAVVYALYRLKYGKPAEVIAEQPHEPGYAERDIDL